MSDHGKDRLLCELIKPAEDALAHCMSDFEVGIPLVIDSHSENPRSLGEVVSGPTIGVGNVVGFEPSMNVPQFDGRSERISIKLDRSIQIQIDWVDCEEMDSYDLLKNAFIKAFNKMLIHGSEQIESIQDYLETMITNDLKTMIANDIEGDNEDNGIYGDIAFLCIRHHGEGGLQGDAAIIKDNYSGMSVKLSAVPDLRRIGYFITILFGCKVIRF